MGEFVCWLRGLCFEMLLLASKKIGVCFEILINLVLLLFLLQELLSLICLNLFQNLCILLVSFWIELCRDWICLEFTV